MAKILLIGPLPPPWGGVRVSFQLFFDYLSDLSGVSFRHFDLPVRWARDANPAGGVNHLKTMAKLLCCLLYIPFAHSVVIIGSRGFCFSYGLVLLLGAKLFGKSHYIRFIGGHPMLALADRSRIVQIALLKFLGLSDKILVETEVGAREFPPDLSSKIMVIPGYRPRIEFQAMLVDDDDDTIRFVYAGSVTRGKGVDTLLVAFSEVRTRTSKQIPLELHIYGAGSEEIVQELLNSPDVHYHGKVDNAVLRERFASYDVFVFPSKHYSEGHPGVLMEALMAGLPIIASALPGPNEVVEDQSNGLLVEPGNVQRLADAMMRLVGDPGLRRRLSEAALASSDRFDAALVIPKLSNALGLSSPDL